MIITFLSDLAIVSSFIILLNMVIVSIVSRLIYLYIYLIKASKIETVNYNIPLMFIDTRRIATFILQLTQLNCDQLLLKLSPKDEAS